MKALRLSTPVRKFGDVFCVGLFVVHTSVCGVPSLASHAEVCTTNNREYVTKFMKLCTKAERRQLKHKIL